MQDIERTIRSLFRQPISALDRARERRISKQRVTKVNGWMCLIAFPPMLALAGLEEPNSFGVIWFAFVFVLWLFGIIWMKNYWRENPIEKAVFYNESESMRELKDLLCFGGWFSILMGFIIAICGIVSTPQPNGVGTALLHAFFMTIWMTMSVMAIYFARRQYPPDSESSRPNDHHNS